ncbi:MAG: YigZ family protein [Pseudomonadales bacterium]|nr:YigZ family protein [Pseudomonadales bacterium]NRA14189.1 YigZ family protein [Oceanospirillaceae bacterium]
MSYYRPSKAVEVTQVIKKSQFIGNSAIVTNSAEAIAFVQQIKRIHSGANHSCHCFIAGLPEQSSYWGYSDDGEPKGTAGMPMFQVLKHSGLGNVCIVVTRYFGGIKLGTGGIARAYSSTVTLTLEHSTTELVQLRTTLCLTVPFNLTGVIEHIIRQSTGTEVLERTWLDNGQQLQLSIEEPSLKEFHAAISPYHRELILLDNT